MKKPKPPAPTPLQREIARRERAIERMKEEIAHLRQWADEMIAPIERRLEERQFVLEALKRGVLT